MNNRILGELARLLGGEITGLARSGKEFGNDEEFGLVIKIGKETKTLWFLSDFEGNGPGGFAIEDYVSGDENP